MQMEIAVWRSVSEYMKIVKNVLVWWKRG